ncbi:hypothetical protein [Winogradskyella alexanderae]|uniref:Uncharacterized protein n=1 Tax=Winogradskyella alexanderae TaxID=2877123 RepID=A0ABS7XRD6_9FLAO|nr:hypothetical protein [Winogradskyella alexanderae]MCA0132589.1 hypothetical protein [Winogradskyella alexanderae]
MKYNYKVTLMAILALITIYGIITGKYLFLVLMFPIGFLFKKKEDDKE